MHCPRKVNDNMIYLCVLKSNINGECYPGIIIKIKTFNRLRMIISFPMESKSWNIIKFIINSWCLNNLLDIKLSKKDSTPGTFLM